MIERVKSQPKTHIELSDTHLTNISPNISKKFDFFLQAKHGNTLSQSDLPGSIPCICEVLVYAKLIIY